MPTKILVVDEKPHQIEPILRWLRQEAFDVILVSHADEAPNVAEQSQPDLMLLNNENEGQNGISICQQIRSNTSTEQLPVILMTQHEPNAARAEMIQAGANDFLIRPIKTTELKHKITALLNAGTLALGDNYRLLDETCQAALIMLSCNLAWLLTIEEAALRSRMIATDRGRGSSAGEVFLRLAAGGEPEHPSYPLIPGSNPISDTLLDGNPLLNITLEDLGLASDNQSLYRAFSQLRLTHIHFLPLTSRGQSIGMMVLGAKQPYDMSTLAGQKMIAALTNQAATVVENARLIAHLSAHEEQMRSEQSFRKMILDTMGDALVVIDEHAKIHYVNQRLLRMTGLTRDDLHGNSVGMIFHPGAREQLVEALKSQGRSTLSFSQRIITRTGDYIPVLMSRASGGIGPGGDRSTVIVLTDLSEQVKREELLERQSERLRALNRAAETITAALTIDDVITVLMHSVTEIMICHSACLFMRDDKESQTFRVVAATGPRAENLRHIVSTQGRGIVGRVAKEQRASFVMRVEAEDEVEPSGSTLIAAPLMLMGHVVGVLEAIDAVGGQFVNGDVEILENLASLASVAIENARLFSQTQQRVNELTTILESSAVVSSTLDIGSVLELIGRRLLDALNVAYCSIASWNRKTNELGILVRVSNTYWKVGTGPQRSPAVNRFLISALGESVSLTYSRGDANLDAGVVTYMQSLDAQSLLIVPLRIDQHSVGLIELSTIKPDVAYNAETTRRVGEALNRWRDQLRKRGSTDWDSRDNLTDLYQRVVRAADASWCIISLLEPVSGELRPVREIGFAVWDEHSPVRYNLQHYPLMARTLSEGTTVTLRDETLALDPAERTLLERAGASTGLLVPLLVRGEAIGLIRLLDVGRSRTFDLAESSLVQGIANVVANAMENAQLYLSLERRANALQAAYDELRLSDKAKDSLIQNVSHELQTPLHKLVMELDLLAEEVYGPLNNEQKEAMQSAISRSTHLGDMIRDMVSVLDLDVEGLNFQKNAIGEIVENAVRTALPKAHQAGLQLVTALPSELPQVRGDAGRLGEVLNQLIDNAIKFSPRGERKADRIEVRVEDTEGPVLKLCVQDFGIGIPDGEFDKIFHKGYQVDGSLTRRFGGTGLGLALARQIVEAHGGKIWVESAGSGGSQFLFTIPKFGVQFDS